MDSNNSEQCDDRVLINLFEAIAKSEPTLPFIHLPKSIDPKAGWAPMNFSDASRAVNNVAWKLAGNGTRPFDAPPATIAYIGPNDVRYVIIMLGCIKAGKQALFISPRNNVEAQEFLFKSTDCQSIWYAEPFGNMVKSWPAASKMNVQALPPIEELLESTSEPFPYYRTFKQAMWDPLVVLHTSGTTGLPKPIVVRQGCLHVADSLGDELEGNGNHFLMKTWADKSSRLFNPMPQFHVSGLLVSVLFPIYYKSSVALGIAERPMNPELVIDCIQHSESDGALLPPRIVEELSWSQHSIEVLSRLNAVGFAGGKLAQSAGDKLAEYGVQLRNFIGSTEYYTWPLYYQPDPKLWRYFHINSKVMGAHWEKVPGRNVYELVVRRKHPEKPDLQSIFYTFPELTEWSTKDLFEPHPTLPDLWAYRGRADDVIVFSNGEKLNPVTLEEIIAGHHDVSGAVVVGQDKFQPALILEPHTPCKDHDAEEAFIDSVWPRIEEANSQAPSHGRIVRWLTMVAPANKPFLRAGKGTIQRKATVELFKEEIEDLYRKSQSNNDSLIMDLNFESQATLTQSIIHLLTERLNFKEISGEQDLFGVGMDSLQVVSLTNILRLSLQRTGLFPNSDVITSRHIYANPTPESLAAYIYSVSKRGDSNETNMDDTNALMKQLLEKHTSNFPVVGDKKIRPLHEGQTVLITGTTGSLGAYLLDQLVNNSKIEKVFALNRGADGGFSRQPSISRARGLGTDFSKVQFLGCDLSKPALGLDPDDYKLLLREVDRVIHNAWPVNFNIAVTSFEPHIRGVRHLVDFAAEATNVVPIVFISSVSTATNWKLDEPVPENQLEDFNLASMGYGRSKLLGSLILDAAHRDLGLPTATIRVGQIAGPNGREGVWNRQEFIPTIIASSVYLGVLPDHLGPYHMVDWIPIEDMATLILDVAGITHLAPANEINGYFHAVNPRKVTWSDLTSTIKDYYGERIKKIVSLAEWVEKLEESAKREQDLEKSPGIKLLDTYRTMLEAHQAGQGSTVFSIERTKERSPTTKQMGPITPDQLVNWCRQWRFEE